MSNFIMVPLLIVFLIYISICCYKYLMYKEVKIVMLKFMSSCMVLLTFTIVFYNDILLHEVKYSKSESRVFSSSNLNSMGRDVPEKVKKVTAYLDNTNPPRGSLINLIVTGPAGGKVTAICQYKGHGTPYIMNIEKNGQAVIPITVENNAEAGYVVVVDVTVNYGGINYRTNTVFTPR